jgi:RNA polymerase sigma-70 factor (ECF subfamily)
VRSQGAQVALFFVCGWSFTGSRSAGRFDEPFPPRRGISIPIDETVRREFSELPLGRRVRAIGSPMTTPKLRLVPSVPDLPGPSDHDAPVESERVVRDRAPTLETLYERYAPYVAAIASRILGRAAEVDDVVQDVFALAVRGLQRREDAREIKGWFAKVTVRRCLRQLQYRRIWALVDLAAEPSYERLADPSAGPEERQLIIEVYRALDRIPARERVPWTLRNVEGESLERVAVLCGCSLATAKRRIASAHEKLNLALKGRAP